MSTGPYQHHPPAAPTPPPRPIWPGAPAAPAGNATLAAVGITLAAVVVLGLVALSAAAVGLTPIVLGTVLAALPLAVLIAAVVWMDRWEPEPRSALFFAFLWGAGAAVVIALIIVMIFETGEVASTVVQAPVVEEIAKGAGLLILVRAARRYIDGPVDGVVYAAMIAAGFTFSEDVLYFADSYLEGGAGDLGAVWVLRGVFSPFLHMMSTAWMGMAVGWAIERGKSGTFRYWLLGLVPAIGVHALWNAGTYLENFLAFYILVQVPLFAIAVAIVAALRRREASVTRERLGYYAASGWFAPGEVEWLATPAGRRRAMAWARSIPGDRRPAMKRLIRDATDLAHVRQRAQRTQLANWPAEEQRLLAAVVRGRTAMLGP